MSSGVIATEGNSITDIRNMIGVTTWPTPCAALIGGGMTWQNPAVVGSDDRDMISRAAAVDALIGVGATKVLVVWELSNDIVRGGAPVLHAYNRLACYCQARRARGWKVIVGTMATRTGGVSPYSVGAIETQRLAVNALVRANWPNFASGIADVGADAVFGNSAWLTDLTLNHGDGVHPTNAGQLLLATIFAAAIRPFVQ